MPRGTWCLAPRASCLVPCGLWVAGSLVRREQGNKNKETIKRGSYNTRSFGATMAATLASLDRPPYRSAHPHTPEPARRREGKHKHASRANVCAATQHTAGPGALRFSKRPSSWCQDEAGNPASPNECGCLSLKSPTCGLTVYRLTPPNEHLQSVAIAFHHAPFVIF